MTLAGARCGQHPGGAAVELCVRCGSFLCGACVDYVDDEPCCARCVPLLRPPPPTWRARVAALTSGVALPLLVAGFLVRGRAGLGLWLASALLATPATVVAALELRRLRGVSGPQRAGWARVGLWLGAMALLGFGVLTVSFLVFIANRP